MLTKEQVDARAFSPKYNVTSLEDMNHLYGRRGFDWKWGMIGWAGALAVPAGIFAIMYPEAQKGFLTVKSLVSDLSPMVYYALSFGYLTGRGASKREGYTLPNDSLQKRLHYE